MSQERRRNHTAGTQLQLLSRLAVVCGPFALAVAIARLARDSSANDARFVVSPVDRQWYDGAIADVNLVLWGIAATVAYFGGWIAFQTGRPTAGRFLRAGGAVASWLLVNDMLLIHADLLPGAGMPVMLSGVLMLLPVLAWIAIYKQEVRRTRWMLLASAVITYQIALLFGSYWSLAAEETVVAEEATLFAACSWALYMVLTTRDIARSTVRTALAKTSAPSPEPALV